MDARTDNTALHCLLSLLYKFLKSSKICPKAHIASALLWVNSYSDRTHYQVADLVAPSTTIDIAHLKAQLLNKTRRCSVTSYRIYLFFKKTSQHYYYSAKTSICLLVQNLFMVILL